MKKEIYVHIPEPCHENWEQMSPLEQGRFCKSCSKQVVDFSQMSDKQILDIISNAAGKTCGRFRPEQLERPIVHEINPSILPYKFFLSAFIPAFLFSSNDAKSQIKSNLPTKTEMIQNVKMGAVVPAITKEGEITGSVKDESGQPFAGASIVIKGSDKGTVTDADGNFKIKWTLGKEKILQVSYVGYRTKEIEVGKSEDVPMRVILSNKDIEVRGEVVVVGSYSTQNFNEEYDAPSTLPKKVTYEGIVVNEQGEGVPYASISLNRKVIIADSSGKFSFDVRQSKKRINVSISSVGYQTHTSTIELNANAADDIKIALKNNIVLNEAVVKCSIPESLTGMVGGLSIVRRVTTRDTANTIIQKVFNNEMFKVYPNPASKGSNLTLTFRKAGNYAVQLFDNSGKLYIQKYLENQTSNQPRSFSLADAIPSGVYFLRATNTSSNTQFIDKLIIQ